MASADAEITKNAEQQTILDDHRALKAMLARIDVVTDAAGLVSLLEELTPLLRSHFGREEAPHGIREDVRKTAPQHLTRLESILSEHEGMLNRCEDVLATARGAIKARQQAIAEAHALRAQLLDHEARESDLFMEAIYTDIGVGD